MYKQDNIWKIEIEKEIWSSTWFLMLEIKFVRSVETSLLLEPKRLQIYALHRISLMGIGNDLWIEWIDIYDYLSIFLPIKFCLLDQLISRYKGHK